MEGPRVRRTGQEGRVAEDEREQHQRVVALRVTESEQVVVGLRLVRRPSRREAREDRPKIAFEDVPRRVVKCLPVRRFGDGVAEEVTDEEVAADERVEARAKPARR